MNIPSGIRGRGENGKEGIIVQSRIGLKWKVKALGWWQFF